jgi:hypothetical protein
MPSLVAGTEVIDTYVNENRSAVTVEFLCHIKAPACTLRILDRFTITSRDASPRRRISLIRETSPTLDGAMRNRAPNKSCSARR